MADIEHPNPTLAERAMTAALEYTRSGEHSDDTLERDLSEVPRPVFTVAATARPMVWAVLAEPERARGFRWLDQHDLLTELLPCWGGPMSQRKLRLGAMEQVHAEAWRPGIDDTVFALLCDTHDVVVDGRLNRWALTALATLLAGGDIEDSHAWIRFVRRDLAALGATEAEIVWVTSVIASFTPALLTLRGEDMNIDLRPPVAVAALSTLSLTEPERMDHARSLANDALQEQVNPLDLIQEDDHE